MDFVVEAALWINRRLPGRRSLERLRAAAGAAVT